MLANRNGCVARSADSRMAWLRGPTITSPNHLEIRTAHGMFVLGRPAAFPPEVCAAAAHHGPMLALSNVRSDPFAIAGIQRWLQKTEFALPIRLGDDRDVLRRVERGIADKQLLALYVADHPAPITRPLANAGAQRVPAARLPVSATLTPAQKADAEVSAMDADDRVLAALQRSGKYMGTLLGARFKELFTPETLLVLTAFLIAGALANTNPVTAAIFDGAMVAFVWYTVGRAGIEALGKLVSATVAAMAAKNEVQLEAAAKTYAEAVIGLGGAVFLAWLARRMGRPEGGGNRTVTAEPAAPRPPKPAPAPAPTRPAPAAMPGDVPLRNQHLAGTNHPKTGIPFDRNGYPDFSKVKIDEVQITQTGTRAGDFRAANQAAGLPRTPEGYTWHHHQDGTTMQLVPRTVHALTGHTGGFRPGP